MSNAYDVIVVGGGHNGLVAAAYQAKHGLRTVDLEKRKVVGGEGDGDEIADELRACAQQEFELQSEMKSASDELTKAEVTAAHLGDRRAEAERDLTAIAERLGEEIPPAAQALPDEERAEFE